MWTSMHLPIPGEPHWAYSHLEVPWGPYTTLGSSLGCSRAAELVVWQLVSLSWYFRGSDAGTLNPMGVTRWPGACSSMSWGCRKGVQGLWCLPAQWTCGILLKWLTRAHGPHPTAKFQLATAPSPCTGALGPQGLSSIWPSAQGTAPPTCPWAQASGQPSARIQTVWTLGSQRPAAALSQPHFPEVERGTTE